MGANAPAACRSRVQTPASHIHVIPTSRPLVEKSHTTGIAATASSPTGTTSSSSECSRRAANPPNANAPTDEREAGDDGCPLDRHEVTEGAARQREHAEPERAGIGLDALARVEHRPVAGEELVDDAEVDERVLVHPPSAPAHHEDERGRRQEHRRLQRPARPRWACRLHDASCRDGRRRRVDGHAAAAVIVRQSAPMPRRPARSATNSSTRGWIVRAHRLQLNVLHEVAALARRFASTQECGIPHRIGHDATPELGGKGHLDRPLLTS